MIKPFKILSIGLCLAVVSIGCAQQETQQEEMETEKKVTEKKSTMDHSYTKAVAVVHPTQDSDVSGTVTFEKTDNGVKVHGNISGLTEGKHGFHVHQYGDCRAGDGTSAGGHYNPANNNHAARSDSARHMGDMGNITADADGNATVDYVDSVIKLKNVVGRAVVVHGGEDDLNSQPSGAAGPRMACGAIGIANPDVMMKDSTMEEESM